MITIPPHRLGRQAGARELRPLQLLGGQVRPPDRGRPQLAGLRATASPRSPGNFIVGNDPNDASVLVDSDYQQALAAAHRGHVRRRRPASGLKYYAMDQEAGIWYSSPPGRAPPRAPIMDEVRDKIIDYGTRIRHGGPDRGHHPGPRRMELRGATTSAAIDNRRRGLGLCDSDDCPGPGRARGRGRTSRTCSTSSARTS